MTHDSEWPALQDRDQAIAWLIERGLFARRHDGWLGEAIIVSRPRHAGSEHAQADALILHPESGAWVVARALPGRRGHARRFDSLGEAVFHAAARFRVARA